MRILVVDDEDELADAIARSLRRDGYAVDVAGGGQDALDRLLVNPYDLVLLDLTMPDIDGLEVCRRIRSDPRHAGTTVVAMTGYPSDETVREIIEAGAVECLSKPIDFEALGGLLEKITGVGSTR